MKEIKFRAWDEELHTFFYFTLKELWVEGCETQLAELSDSKHLSLNTDFPYKNIKQYTGLKDKNGKEIYEGDIIKSVSHMVALMTGRRTGNIKTFIYSVVYDSADLVWYVVEKNGNRSRAKYYLQNNTVEIIGNVYENPELMEAEDDNECPECDGNGFFCDEPCIPNPGQCINCKDTSSKRICPVCKGTGLKKGVEK